MTLNRYFGPQIPRWTVNLLTLSRGALWDLSLLAQTLSSLTFIFSVVNLGPLPKKSGPNPMSFQFMTGGIWSPRKVQTPP